MKLLTALTIGLLLTWLIFSYIQRQTMLTPSESTNLPTSAQFAISSALGRDLETYHALPTHDGYQLINPAQALTADFTPERVQMTAGVASWQLTLVGWGYGNNLQPVIATVPQANANRIEYRRGPLTEWYVNGPWGLQQGFTLATAPETSSVNEPLTLAMASNLPSVVDPDGRGLAVAGLRYSDLTAYDTTGRVLPAWLETHNEQLLLHVDDTGARYPLVIDPFVQAAKLLASDGATNARFGYSVAVDGDTVVVGADLAYIGPNYGQGAAYVFVKPPNGWGGTLTQTAKLIASDGTEGDQLGWSVAISGDTIVAGALGDDLGTTAVHGSAYVFVKPPGGWNAVVTETAKLIASDEDARFFGDAVAIDGDTVVVGARHPLGQGSAYIFVKPSGGWVTTSTFTAKLIAPNGSFSNLASISVSINGNTVIVGGAKIINVPGSAYIFVKPATGWNGILTETAELTVSNGATSGFGWSTGISGDTAVVGIGTAYVFVKPNDGWGGTLTETAVLTSSDGIMLSGFGGSVAINSDTIVAGAAGADIDGNIDQGAAYIFVKPPTGWTSIVTETTKLTATDGVANDYFGHSVGIDNNTIVVGAVRKDSFTGSAYIFTPTSVDLDLTKSDGQTSATSGTAITYTIIVTNSGPNAVTGALVSDPMPVALTGVTWLCTPFGGASCGLSGGTGNISTTVNLPTDGLTVFTATGAIAPLASGILTNTASLIVPAGFIDPNSANNSATDTTTLIPLSGFPMYLPMILH